MKKDLSFITDLSCTFNLFKIKISYIEKNIKINFLIINKLLFTKNLNKLTGKENKYNEENKNYKNSKNKLWQKSDKKFLSYIISYVKDMLSIVKPLHIKIQGVYGFEEPSITGTVCALIALILEIIPCSSIKLYPIFDDDLVDIELEIWGKLNLALLIFITLKFIVKKEVRNKLFRKSKTVHSIG